MLDTTKRFMALTATTRGAGNELTSRHAEILQQALGLLVEAPPIPEVLDAGQALTSFMQKNVENVAAADLVNIMTKTKTSLPTLPMDYSKIQICLKHGGWGPTLEPHLESFIATLIGDIISKASCCRTGSSY